MIKCRFSGADWIKDSLKKDLSPLGANVADILGNVFKGIYHLERSVHKVDWADPRRIEVTIRRDLSTFDFDHLTQLVFECHERRVRLELDSRGLGYLRLAFYQRKAEGCMSVRHPNLDEAVSEFRRLAKYDDLKENKENNDGK